MASIAYRRILSVRSTLLQASRFNPSSLTYISHNDDHKKSNEMHSSAPKMQTFLNQSFRRTPYGVSFRREISTAETIINGVGSTFKVVVAKSDSVFTVSAVQHLIDGVHSITGLNWWASIVVATLLVRGATIPYYIYDARKMYSEGMESKAEENKLMKVINYLSYFTIKLGLIHIEVKMENFVQATIFTSFFFGILNMAEKVPSFTTGGALWFTDLSTPDARYIFPVFVLLINLYQAELQVPDNNPQKINDPLIEQSIEEWKALTKDFTRLTALLSVFGLIFLPKAVFFYWIPSNMVIFILRCVLAHPRGRKALGIPSYDN